MRYLLLLLFSLNLHATITPDQYIDFAKQAIFELQDPFVKKNKLLKAMADRAGLMILCNNENIEVIQFMGCGFEKERGSFNPDIKPDPTKAYKLPDGTGGFILGAAGGTIIERVVNKVIDKSIEHANRQIENAKRELAREQARNKEQFKREAARNSRCSHSGPSIISGDCR